MAARSRSPLPLCALCGERGHVGKDCCALDIADVPRSRGRRDTRRSRGRSPRPRGQPGQRDQPPKDAGGPCRPNPSRAHTGSVGESPVLPLLPPATFPPAPPGPAPPGTAAQPPPQEIHIQQLMQAMWASMAGQGITPAQALPPANSMPPPPASPAPQAAPPNSPSALGQVRQLIGSLPYEDLVKLVFDRDEASTILQRIAYGVPPDLAPDIVMSDPRFKEARAACNAEMMRRCQALCTPKVRTSSMESPGDYVPYVMRAQARRNFQKVVPLIPFEADTFNFNVFLTWLVNNSPYTMKKDGLIEMISKVASGVVDESQAGLEAEAAASEAAIIPDASLRALGRRGSPGIPDPSAAAAKDALVVTLEDLRNYAFDKLHSGRAPRSLEWALEDRGISQDDSQAVRTKHKAYLAALKALIPKPPKDVKPKDKPKLKQQTQETNAAFEKATQALGVKFDAARLPDIAQLVAAIRARVDELEG